MWRWVSGVCACVLLGCGDPSGPILANPTLVGQIIEMDTTRLGLRILVAEAQGPLAADGDMIWFSVTASTVLLRTDRSPAYPTDLRIGRRVAAVTRFIRDSYPGLAHADTLLVR